MLVLDFRKAFVGEWWCHAFQVVAFYKKQGGERLPVCSISLLHRGSGCWGCSGFPALGGRGRLGGATRRILVNRGLEEPKAALEAVSRSPRCWDMAADRHACGVVQPLSHFIPALPLLPCWQLVPCVQECWGCLTAALQGARPVVPSLPCAAPVLSQLWLSYSGNDGRWHLQFHKIPPHRFDRFTDF